MIDVVYVVGAGSKWEDNELRYSLRSLARHVRGINKVWVVGQRPAWCTAYHIPCSDIYTHNKDANIIRKVLAACSDDRITEKFLFVNDDHFFLERETARYFPNYAKGPLWSSSKSVSYVRRVENTRAVLRARGYPAWHFDVHAPMVIDRLLCAQTFNMFDYVDVHGPGLLFKSIYGNALRLPPIAPFDDLKVGNHFAHLPKADLDYLFSWRPVFSTAPTVTPNIRHWLEDRFPDPSPWELSETSNMESTE